jgi:kynurenine formamidase
LQKNQKPSLEILPIYFLYFILKMEIIDLSQPIFSGMPVFKGMPEVKISVHATHEEWEGLTDATSISPSVNRLELSEHTGTHVDALSHMTRQNFGQTIDTMPLSSFFTEGVCLDFSHKKLRELIEPKEVEMACKQAKIEIKQGDTVLFYTDHYRKTYGTPDWTNGMGISADTAVWLGQKSIAAFGVEMMSPGVSGVSNRDVHRICGEMGFTHYECLINLHLLIGRGRFRFIGFPLNIRGGTGSPVRAVAVFGMS